MSRFEKLFLAWGFVIIALNVAVAVQACSGDVEVHGVPKKIELEAPFCTPPPADAGAQEAGQ